jgi:hypothetical protein
MLKLYHVSRPANILGYDSYSEFVVAANSEEEARRVHPCGCDNWQVGSYEWVSIDKVGLLNVVEIGTAASNLTVGTVIVASYHAG